MHAQNKDARLDLRMTSAQRDLIGRAADLSGSTVTGYAVTRLVEEARKEIEQSKRIALDADEWDAFTAIIDSPADDSAWRGLLDRPAPWTAA
ncbi:MAG: DUF1778 domain-containing protein [Propionibacteriaceae bacterium]|nr:DUF1778 domain-containing protein [Propionibacteriaceae bacterium]